jgi:hypothetical protein
VCVCVCARVHECTRIALLIQHEKCKHCTILLYVASLAPPHFSTLSDEWYDFQKKNLMNIKCVFGFSLQHLSKTFLIL